VGFFLFFLTGPCTLVLGRSINVKNGKIMVLQTANDAGQKPKMTSYYRVLDL